MQRTELFGVPVDLGTKADALSFVEKRIREKKRTFITTPNPEFIVDAQGDKEFRAILQKADLALPDGSGIIWALRIIKGRPSINPLRLPGVDFMLALCKRAAEQKWTVSLLGGGENVAEETKKVLERRFPGIRICVLSERDPSTPPFDLAQDLRPFDFTQGSAQDDVKRHLLFVALGHKKQERFIVENQGRLGAAVAMGVGGAFDYISGRVPRAPQWMQSAGFEWLFRLFVQPWRIKRQWKLLVFVFLVLRAYFYVVCLRRNNPL